MTAVSLGKGWKFFEKAHCQSVEFLDAPGVQPVVVGLLLKARSASTSSLPFLLTVSHSFLKDFRHWVPQ